MMESKKVITGQYQHLMQKGEKRAYCGDSLSWAIPCNLNNMVEPRDKAKFLRFKTHGIKREERTDLTTRIHFTLLKLALMFVVSLYFAWQQSCAAIGRPGTTRCLSNV